MVPQFREDRPPDIPAVDRGEAVAENVPDRAIDHAILFGQRDHIEHIVAAELVVISVVLDPVEVVRHFPAPALGIDPGHHLLADLDQIERDQDLVECDQLGAVFSIEGGFGLLRGECISAVRRFIATIGPDGVGVEQADALEPDQRRELGDDAVPVPEPAATAGIFARPDRFGFASGNLGVGIVRAHGEGSASTRRGDIRGSARPPCLRLSRAAGFCLRGIQLTHLIGCATIVTVAWVQQTLPWRG